MDRVEKKRKPAAEKSRFANERSVSEGDRRILETPQGRENDQGESDRNAITEDEVRRTDIGARPRSEVTGRHDPGMGANETDGLDPISEATRRAAENIPEGGGEEEDVPPEKPVFERRS
ncbi:MAG TPA: hypothetical protein VFT69_12395 [Pseudolabrys sp.]|jgi:hypothetical protein|nr:hypothetical protein [Pseudolabrys sp.]